MENIQDNAKTLKKKYIPTAEFYSQMIDSLQTRGKNKGAGIGLLLVKGFLEKNGGEIWVESIEGEGSSFYFTLPIEKPQYKVGASAKVVFDANT